MSGRASKKIRKGIYGEYSPKDKKYDVISKEKYSKQKKKIVMVPVMLVNIGLRAAYQKAKKEYNRKRRG